MIERAKKLVSVLAVLTLILMLVPAAFADTSVNLDRTGSIEVSLLDNSTGTRLTGFALMLYRVADVYDTGAQLGCRYTSDFTHCGIALENINDPQLASHLAKYASDQKLTCAKRMADSDTVLFDALQTGLYLIVQDGAIDRYYQMSPFLVSLPMTGSNGNEWVYDISAKPKAEKLPEKPADKKLTVEKEWDNGNASIPDSITVTLLKDGKSVEDVKLNNANSWKHTWEKLENNAVWTVIEKDVPNGYTVEYKTDGDVITVTNRHTSYVPPSPQTITVKKVWEDNGKNRPGSVTVQLMSDGKVIDTQTLNAANNWTYTWTDISISADWGVTEKNVPNGYAVRYTKNGNLVIVTNSTRLIQTGQLIWPIPVLAGCGLVLFTVGWGMRKRQESGDET